MMANANEESSRARNPNDNSTNINKGLEFNAKLYQKMCSYLLIKKKVLKSTILTSLTIVILNNAQTREI